MTLLIVGCGYVGERVARLWQADGESVAALTRGGDRIAQLESQNIAPIIGDWLEPQSIETLPAVRSILVAVPHRPDERFGPQTHCIGLANILSRAHHFEQLVVLSTTGVYHQGAGERVDEDSPVDPPRIGPQVALAAERWLAARLPADRATSLRLAGIYGPGRIPLVAKLHSEEPLPVADGFLNLIHVDDIAQVVVRLLRAQSQSQLYVLSDGQPVERRTFYTDAAEIFGTPPPRFITPPADSSRSARSESNKRIDPQRIFRELDLRLQFPNHRAGLSAIAAQAGR